MGWAHQPNRVLRTSGSSGAPLVVRRTMLEERLMLAHRAKAVGAWGYGPRTRRANIDHFSPESLATEAHPMLYERLGIMPRLNLDWRTPKDQIVSQISEFKPDLISGPPSLLAELADALTDDDRARIGATHVLTGAELMTASDRTRIERGFGCPVADIYGCVETVFIAMQTPRELGYRICEEAVIVEVLHDGSPADRGEIVLTPLHQWSMPFIRYRLGDQAVLMEGGGIDRRIRSIDGRVTDRFLLPDGRHLHGYTLGQLVEECDLSVRRFQITQTRPEMFCVRLVLDPAGHTGLAPLKQRFQYTLGPGVQLRIEVVDTIDRPQRKFYPFISYERFVKLSEQPTGRGGLDSS